MVLKNESYELVEFKHRTQTAYEKPAKWIEFLHAPDNDLIFVLYNVVVLREYINKSRQVEQLSVFWRPLELFVDFFDYIVRYHSLSSFLTSNASVQSKVHIIKH